MGQIVLLGRYPLDLNNPPEYPRNFFYARIILYYHKSLLKNSRVVRFVRKAFEDYNRRYDNLDLSGLPDTLFPYQQLDLAFSLKYKRTAWFWEQALGKTFTASEFLRRLEGRKLVVAPKRVIADSWLDLTRDVENLVVINYERLPKVDRQPDVIVFDEAHYLKSTSSKRHRLARSLARKAKYVLHLTGTPVTRDPFDLYGQMSILWPEMFVNKHYFTREFVILDRTGTFPVGWKNLDKLLRRVKAVSSVRKKAQYLPDLPGKRFHYIVCKPSPEQVTDYTNIESSLQTDGVVLQHLITRYQKMHQISADVLYLDNGTVRTYPQAGKLKWLEENLPKLLEESQIVIWHQFRAEGDLLEQLTRKLGIPTGRVQGGSSYEPVRDFKLGKTKVLIANTKSLAEGVNLQNASIEIFHSLPWSYREFAQSIDRLHRPGQVKDVQVYILTYSDPVGIDGRILESLSEKRDFNPV
jgi:hypothetical protein